MKKISILALAMILGLTAFGQSSTIAEFEKSSDGYKLFLYQSVIRVLNRDHNPDFNMLIRNLDHLRFVTAEADDEKAMETFQWIDQGVQSEGFEEIMSFDDVSNKCRIYEMESSRGQSTWVVTLLMDDIAGALEMKGSLDLKYINALSSLNMDRLEEMLPLEKQRKQKEKKIKKKEIEE